MKPLWKVLACALAAKLAVLALVAASPWILPFFQPAYWANFQYPFDEEPTLRSCFKTWDANHYLFLADWGYQPQHISSAFYPLLPFLLKLLRPLAGGDALVAGLVLSTAAFLGAVAYLFLLVRAERDEATASRACLLLVAFPTTFYAGLLYTEALFLLLAVGLFFHLRRNELGLATAFAFLLPLTRPTGLMVALPATVAVAALAPAWRPAWRKLPMPLAFAVGFAAYLGILYASTGDALAGFDAQKVFLAQNSLANVLHPLDWFTRNFVEVKLSWNGFTTSVLDRAAFVLFVAAVATSWRRLDRAMLVFVLVVGGIPALTGSMTSYVRYVAVVFPLFACVAGRLGRAFPWVVGAGTVLQAAAVVVHASNRWIG
ncbi:MAG: mannosyltransferase family protein [Anaeromyxobacteraceae bacterium]